MKRLLVFCAAGLLAWASSAQAASMDEAVATLQQQWAVIKYQMPDKEKQKQSITTLVAQAGQVSQSYPDKAEPLIWQAIIVSTKAGITGGLGALSDAKQARNLLLQAEKINPDALKGSVYTSLGSLYYKVPGWPVGFGDNTKAKEYLEKALAMNPDGIDPNFFYGELLYESGDYSKSKTTLEHALNAPARPGRELADKGRREEIQELLVKVNKKLS
jgi:tetratricopeptide (TPR) repeat protein